MTPWGDLAFGWRGHDGLASDGAKLGRQVLGSSTSEGPGLLAGQGWAWGYDAGVRMTVAESGSGSLLGASTESGAAAADRSSAEVSVSGSAEGVVPMAIYSGGTATQPSPATRRSTWRPSSTLPGSIGDDQV